MSKNISVVDGHMDILKKITMDDLQDMSNVDNIDDIKSIAVHSNACDDALTISLVNILRHRYDANVDFEDYHELQEVIEIPVQAYRMPAAANLHISKWKNMMFVAKSANIAEKKIWLVMFKDHLQYSLLDNFWLISIFFIIIGMIILYTSFANMNQYGAGDQAGFLLTVGGIDILVPMLTNILLAAKIGIGTAHKIQSMKANEEITALRLMLIDVNKFILNPMACSFMISLMILTFIGVINLIIGGYIAWFILGKSSQFFINAFIMNITNVQIMHILVRSIVAGILTSIIACGCGLHFGGSDNNTLSISSIVIELSVLSNIIIQAFLTWIFLSHLG